MIRNRFPLFIAALSLAAVFILAGCDKTTDTKETTPLPTVAQFSSNVKSVTVSINGTASIALWGAKKPYAVQAITPDSSKLWSESFYTYVTNSTSGNATLYVRGKAKGTSTVIVRDSAGTATIAIEVTVQTISFSQSAVTVEVGSASSTSLSIYGGVQPYAIKVKPDSTKATAVLSGSTLYLYSGATAGTTFLTLKDNSTPAETAQVAITAVAKMRLGRNSMTILAGNSDTTSVYGGTAPYEIAGYDAAKLSASVSGSVVTFTVLQTATTGSTSVTVADNTTPAKLGKSVSIYIESPYLTKSVDTLRATVGGSQASGYVAGGTSPYSIRTKPDTTIAKASMSGSYVYVTAVAAGLTSLTVQDATAPTAKTVIIPIKITAAAGTNLTASVNPVSVAVSGNQTTVISGGTPSYSIQTSPSSSVATATIAGATVTVHGVAAGSTTMVVKDASSPVKTLTINITVSSGGGSLWTTAGTLNFTTTLATSGTVRSFAANGIYDPAYVGSSGAGAILSSGAKTLSVYAFKAGTATGKFDVAVMIFNGATTYGTGNYTVASSGTGSVTFMYYSQLSSADTLLYMLSSGSANLNTFTTSTATGTISGSGLYMTTGVYDSFDLTNGTFNVPIYNTTLSNFSPLEQKVRDVVERLTAKASARR